MIKRILKNIFLFILIFTNLTGFFFLASVIFSLIPNRYGAKWVFEAVQKTRFQNETSRVSKSFQSIKVLEGQEREKILEFLKVDVNHASLEELDSLPRIGPKMAQRIIDERQAKGVFTALKDLERVKGIGPKTIEKLKGRVRFGPFELEKKKGEV